VELYIYIYIYIYTSVQLMLINMNAIAWWGKMTSTEMEMGTR
jgi:hypothetical protein